MPALIAITLEDKKLSLEHVVGRRCIARSARSRGRSLGEGQMAWKGPISSRGRDPGGCYWSRGCSRYGINLFAAPKGGSRQHYCRTSSSDRENKALPHMTRAVVCDDLGQKGREDFPMLRRKDLLAPPRPRLPERQALRNHITAARK